MSKRTGLSKAKGVEYGYGQVEANRLTGITFGNIEAQAPAYEIPTEGENTTKYQPIDQLENGMFLCVIAEPTEAEFNVAANIPMGRIAVRPGDAKAKAAKATPYLVYSEKKIYDERFGYNDFADLAADKVDGVIYPRLIGLTPDSCVFTTNTVNVEDITELTVGSFLYIGNDGILTDTAGDNTVYKFAIDKVYTMPDNQPAVKVHCVRGN